MGDRSIVGLPDESGVLLLDLPDGSAAQKWGLKTNDVIVAANGKSVRTITDLLDLVHAAQSKNLRLTIIRNQRKISINIS
jgi:S1-C subfamily serine protease